MKKLELSKKDKIAYALIVLLGVIAFAISTFLLMEPKEADAATTVEYITRDGVQTTTVYDIREVSWDYWLNNTQPSVLAWYDNPENLANDIIAECNYLVVVGSYYFFYIEPFYHDGSLSGQNNIYLNYDNGYRVDIRMRDGVPSVSSVVGMYDNYSNADSSWSVMYNGGSNVIGSTYDFLINCTDSLKSNVTRNNLTYPEPLLYWDPSLDAYDRLGNCPEGNSIEYLSVGKWKIIHEALYDTLGTGAVYPWASFQIALPSLDWVKSWEGKSKEQVCTEEEIINWRTTSNDIPNRFDILDYVPADSNKGHVNSLKDYFYIDLKTYISENWSTLYGDLSEEYLDYVVEYAYPDILVLRSFYVSYGSRVFGPANIIRMYSLSLGLSWNHEIIYCGGGTASQKVSIWLSRAQSQSDEENIINDMAALKTELQKKNELIRELQTQIEWLEAEVTRLLRDSSVDIVGIFDGLVDAITGLPAIFATLGSVIGSVLSFLPGPITALMIAGLGAWIVVSIVNAIRGK